MVTCPATAFIESRSDPDQLPMGKRRPRRPLLLTSAVFPAISQAQGAPVFEISPVESWIKFDVKASIDIAGKFDKWDAHLTFTSPDETTGDLEIKIQADSVDTGSGMKNRKLKGKDFFDIGHNPVITFKSTKIVLTGHGTYDSRYGASQIPRS
jgi:polyisoprenoid-binding protein YceI